MLRISAGGPRRRGVAADKSAEAPSLEASIEISEADSSEPTNVCFDLAVIRGEETSADD